jgi:hypothetical protein
MVGTTKMGDPMGLSVELQAVVERVRSRRLAAQPLAEDHVPTRGDIYLAREPWERRRRRHVLVVQVDEDEDSVDVILLGHYREFATDRDLVLEPSQTGLPFVLVAYCDLRAPIWTIQLEEYQGLVAGDVLDLLPKVFHGAAPDSVARSVGLPLKGEDDPRRSHKHREFLELHRIAHDRMAASLTGRPYFGGIESPSADIIVTIQRVLGEGITPSNPDIAPDAVAVLDPAILTTPLADPSEEGAEVYQLKNYLERHPQVVLPFSIQGDGERLQYLIKRQYPRHGTNLINALARRGSGLLSQSGRASEGDVPEIVLIEQAV